jgi:hypothetical protein
MRRFLISLVLAVSAVGFTAATSMAGNWPGN